MDDYWMDDDPTPEEVERIRRRRVVRTIIVLTVVVAMVAAFLIPVIVRMVRPSRSPDTVIVMHIEAEESWHIGTTCVVDTAKVGGHSTRMGT